MFGYVLYVQCVCVGGMVLHWVLVRCGYGCVCVVKAGMCLDECVGESVLYVSVYGVWECVLALGVCVCVSGVKCWMYVCGRCRELE